jgi:hypothetical protein
MLWKISKETLLLGLVVAILLGWIICGDTIKKWAKDFFREEKVYWGESGFVFQPEDSFLRKGATFKVNIGFKEGGEVVWTPGAEIQPPPPEQTKEAVK